MEIYAAEHMLHDFYALILDLYGEQCCTANVHLLSHLAKLRTFVSGDLCGLTPVSDMKTRTAT